MFGNIADITCSQQIGLSSYFSKINRRRLRKYGARKVQISAFNEHHMKDIFCLNNRKYLVPGDVESEVPPYAVEFCTAPGNEQTFAVADENGVISLFSANDNRQGSSYENSLTPLHRVQAHKNAIFDIAWVPHENSLITASGDQTAALWDMAKGEVATVFKGHSCSLKSINVSKHNTDLLVTGSRDGNALVWDRRSPSQAVVRIQDAHVIKDCLTPMRKKRRMSTVDSGQLGIDSRQTVSSAIFQNSNTVISSGAMDGMLKIWDLRKIHQSKKTAAKSVKKDTPLETIPYPGVSQRRRGYTCLTLDSSHTQLYASCTDDSIYHYNLSTSNRENNSRRPICRFEGHYNTSFYVRSALSPDNEFLLSGSDNNKAYIWKATEQRKSPVLRLMSDGMSEVTAVAWCPYDIAKLVTCSDECVVRLWNFPFNGRENIKDSDIDGQAELMPETKELPTIIENAVFTPKSIVRVDPISQTTSPLATKLITPQKTKPATTPPSGNKRCTPLRGIGNIAIKTPTSIEKWIIRTPTQKNDSRVTENQNPFMKSRAVKCLEDHMTNITQNEKENTLRESSCNENKEKDIVCNKNWLKDLSKRRRSKGPDESPIRKKQKHIHSSPSSKSLDVDKTPVKNSTLKSYFTSPS